MADDPARPRTRTGRRIILVIPENASPQVMAFSNEVKALLDKSFIVRMETDEEVTPIETQLKEFPFVVKILG